MGMEAAVSPLPDDVAALKALLNAATRRADEAEARLANAKARESATEAMIAHLKLQIAKLKREAYGASAERSKRLLAQMELQLEESEAERLLKLEDILHKRVISQDEAVTAVARAVRRAHAGLKDPRRPVGSFLFLGPTGVGKTELARALAEALFGDEDAMIRLDMSEYMERHTVSRLIGAPPGYVGYEEAGQLTEKVRRRPYSVVLFDEIEKAHPEVFNILLQVLEDGRLTDGQGRTVDFRNTVLIMTSNVGATQIHRDTVLGFRTEEDEKNSYERMRDKVLSELKRTFRPEFLNRVDEVIVFHALGRKDMEEIVDLMLGDLKAHLEPRGIHLTFTDGAKSLLVEEGYNPDYGARPLRRVIQRMVEDRLSDEILEGNIRDGQSVEVNEAEGKLVFKALELQRE